MAANKRSIEDTPIVLVGAGRLATNLGKALYCKGFRIVQVYSRTEESARQLAEQVEAAYTTDLTRISGEGRLYIVALKDEALLEWLPALVAGREQALWVHTAGSVPMSVWQDWVEHYGVFYPMQTFSKQREVDFREIPLFVEASGAEELSLLKKLGSVLSNRVSEATSEQRKSLHLAAVFACNFTNHMYALADKLLQRYGLSFDAMLPLVDETARKVHTLPPKEAQTGPAVRYDRQVIQAHLDLLADDPGMQQIYRLLSDSIHNL